MTKIVVDFVIFCFEEKAQITYYGYLMTQLKARNFVCFPSPNISFLYQTKLHFQLNSTSEVFPYELGFS